MKVKLFLFKINFYKDTFIFIKDLTFEPKNLRFFIL